MNTSRRGTGRKSQNVPRENTQSISRFVNRRTKQDLVEIDDDDEVEDLTDQFAFTDEELQPIQVKRKKKQLILEEDSDDDDIDDLQDVDENERKQLKEALRQSRLDMEIDAKRRAADTSLKAKSTKSCETSENKVYSDDETQDYLSENIQSSHTNSGLERQQVERAESPDLFGTPRSNDEKDELENTPDTLNSPSKRPMKSKTIFSDDIAVRITPIKRQLDSSSKNKLKLKKKESSKEQEKEVKLSSNDKEVDSFIESKKRKHCLDEEDNNAGNSEDEFAGKDSKKKQKTIDQVFNVSHVKKDERQKVRTSSPPHVVINDDDDDEEDDSIKQEDEKEIKRNDPTSKVKKAVRTRLERVYKKPKLSIRTIKDAMKARLYFAPAGIDPKAYTYAIVRMMDHTRKCIYRAQKKSLNFIKWGKPVLVGPREANSLDARKEKKKSIMVVAPMSAHGTGEERKRSLRSAQIQATSAPAVKTKPAEPTIEESTRKRTSYIDSDESDDDLTKSVFGDEATTKPKPSWKEYLSNKESDTFGENVVTATDYKENAVGTNAFKRENSTTNVPSSSHTSNTEASRDDTPVKQTEICGNGNKRIKREQRSEEFEKIPNIVDMDSALNSKDKSYDESPSKYSKNGNNDENVEVLGMGEDNGTPNKAKANEKRGIPGLDVKDEEDIDSSTEISIKKSKRNGKKALIEEVEEEGSHGSVPKFGIEIKDENENENDQDTCTISAAQDSKPGASLTNVAVNSGYLKVDRSPKKPPGLQRVMSSAARRAAEAAEKRMRASVPSHSSPEISSSADPSQDIIPNSDNSRVECPMCFSKFLKEDIETHAATCDGSAPVFLSPRKPTTSSASHKSIGSPTDSEGQRSDKDYGLKDLKVMVTRSPEAHRKLMEQRSLSSSKARRNLSLNKASRGGAGSANSEDGGVRRSRRFIDMTGDDDEDEDEDDAPKTKDEISQEQKEDSQPYDWFSSASQLERKKNKFRVKYGGKKKSSLDPRESPFATLDFIPLEENPSSIETVDHGNYHHAVEKEGEDDEYKSGIEKMDEKKDDSKDVMSENASTSKVVEADRKLDTKYGSIDSDSAESDIEIFAAYGVKVQSKKRKCESEDPDARNINDILRPQRQENPTKKKKTTEDFDEDYENEMALLELSGVPMKRSNVGNKSKERLATKRRHKRISSSDESDDNNDEFENCYICFERVPKEEYKDHTDACLKRNDASFVTPGKGSGKASDKSDISSSPRTRSKSTIKPPKAESSEQIIEMDSDEIGDSPIKTFKLIGEDSGSCVDFSNQFSFFKGRESKRSSRGSGRNRGGNKYRGKGRYMHKRGRGKRKK